MLWGHENHARFLRKASALNNSISCFRGFEKAKPTQGPGKLRTLDRPAPTLLSTSGQRGGCAVPRMHPHPGKFFFWARNATNELGQNLGKLSCPSVGWMQAFYRNISLLETDVNHALKWTGISCFTHYLDSAVYLCATKFLHVEVLLKKMLIDFPNYIEYHIPSTVLLYHYGYLQPLTVFKTCGFIYSCSKLGRAHEDCQSH